MPEKLHFEPYLSFFNLNDPKTNSNEKINLESLLFHIFIQENMFYRFYRLLLWFPKVLWEFIDSISRIRWKNICNDFFINFIVLYKLTNYPQEETQKALFLSEIVKKSWEGANLSAENMQEVNLYIFFLIMLKISKFIVQ